MRAQWLSTVEILAPRPEGARSATEQALLTASRSAIDDAFQHLLDPADPAAGYSKAPPLAPAEQNLCSAPFRIDVPTAASLGQRRWGGMRIKTRTTDNGVTLLRRNRSELKLICKPAA